jgi:hypothetical protein
MLLDYASPSMRPVRLGLAVACALASAACGIIAAWCVVHAVHVAIGLQQISVPFCGVPSYDEQAAKLGLPLERTIPVGVLCSGCAVVAAIQSIRCVNGIWTRRGPSCGHSGERPLDVNP